jgi:hypothetical protein
MVRPGGRLRLAVLCVVLTAAVVLAALWVAARGPAKDPAAQGDGAAAGSPVGMPDPAVQEPVEPPADEVAADPPVETTGGSVDVVVTFAGWEESTDAVEVSGFVPGVVEAGGTCRLTLTRGQQAAVAETPAEPDASTTVCGTVSVPAAELSEGTWKGVLSYESVTSTGASVPADVEVPAR